MALNSPLSSPLQPATRGVLGALTRTDIYRAIFGQTTPGARWHIDEAMRANQAARGPELVVNGGFDVDTTGWAIQAGGTISVVSQTLQISGAGFNAHQSFATVVGRSYIFLCTPVSNGAQCIVDVGTAIGGGQNLTFGSITAPISAVFTATEATTFVSIRTLGSAARYDNISVREINLSRCMIFQDSAGTLPVFAVEQPIGLVLDCRHAPGSRGPELVVNGDFSNGTTGWSAPYLSTISNVSGRLRVTATGDNPYVQQFISSLVIGKTYSFTSDAPTGVTSGSWEIGLGNATGLAQFQYKATNSNSAAFVFTATTTQLNIQIVGSGVTTGHFADFDNISVREIPGLPLTQSSTMARPAASARVNLRTLSESFAGNGWEGETSVTANQGIAPDGTNTATLLTPNVLGNAPSANAATGNRRWAQNTLPLASYTNSIHVRTASIDTSVTVYVVASNSDTVLAEFNITTNSTWQRIRASAAITGAMTGVRFVIASTQACLIWGADLRLSVNATPALPAYQRVTTASDYDTAGFPFKAVFNGTNQWLTHAALDMTSTDEVTLWAAVLYEAVGVRMIYEQSALSDSANGSAVLYTNAPICEFRNRGTTTAIASTAASFAPPNKSAIIGRAKIGTDVANLSIAGTQVATSPADQGIGNNGNHVGFVGARGGTAFFFRGEIFELGLAGRVITAGQLASLNARMTRSAKI